MSYPLYATITMLVMLFGVSYLLDGTIITSLVSHREVLFCPFFGVIIKLVNLGGVFIPTLWWYN